DSRGDEEWAIFARRFGDEGFCSDEQHYLDELQGDKYTFRLKWRPGATALMVSPSSKVHTKLGQASGPEVVWAANQGVLVSFTMPVPQSGEGELVDCDLHLAWTMGRAVRPPIPVPFGPRPVARPGAALSVPQQGREESEVAFEKLLSSMSPAQRKLYDAKISPRTISREHATLRPVGPARQVAS